MKTRHLLRFFDCLAHPNLSATLATDQKWPLSHLRISCYGNGTLLNFGKRYDNNLRVIFDQWLQLHLGLDALSNQKNLERYLMETVGDPRRRVRFFFQRQACKGTCFFFQKLHKILKQKVFFANSKLPNLWTHQISKIMYNRKIFITRQKLEAHMFC